MKVTKTCPQWAIDLVTKVCKDYKRALPKQLQWYQSDLRDKSSGHAGWGKIHITAGCDELDSRLVLLHELAHHITQKTQKVKRRYAYHSRNSRVFEGHSIRFWRLAVTLYKENGVDMEYAFDREKDYKKKAIQAFQE